MHAWRTGAAAMLVAAALLTIGCTNPLGRQYEYEEQLYLGVDGSATVVVDSSIAAFVSLRGLPLRGSQERAVDRDEVRAIFESAGCPDPRVGQPWVRHGRRFVQVRIAVTHISALETCGPLAWSRYGFERDGETIRYVQEIGPSAGGDAGEVGWDGTELVAFKLHAPSRVFYHNVRRLEDNAPGEPGRGNILTWEQRLADRQAGRPLRLEVHMGAESILIRTLLLFAGAAVAAVAVLATLIWLTIRRARRKLAPRAPAPS